MAFDVEMPDGTIIQDIPDGTPKDVIQKKWEAMSRPVKSPTSISEMYKQAGSPAVSMPSGTILDEPYRAGIGRRFTEIGGAIRQTFSGQEESDRIAAQLAAEQASIRAGSTPEDLSKYETGYKSAQLGEVAAGMRYIPPLTRGGFMSRAAYNAGLGGAIALSTQPGAVGESNIERAALPALVGGGMSLGVEGAMALRQPVRTLFAARAEDAINQPIARAGARISDETRIRGRSPLMTVAEETQDPKLLSYQRSALASAKGQKLGSKFENIQRAQQ